MKPLGVVTVAAALAFLAEGAGASKPVPPATMDVLATAWVGGTAWSEYVRLDLGVSGRGTMVVQYLPKHPVKAYRITRTVLAGYVVNFQIEPADSASEPIRLGGRAYPMYLELQLSGTDGQWKMPVRLERLRDLTESLDAVTRRINDLGTHDGTGGV